jgi:hypothetical protein
MTDYSKWDALSRAEEEAEEREKERKRAENRQRYFKEQEEKKKKFLQEQEAKKNAGGHGHAHGGDGHGHSHGDSGGDGSDAPNKDGMQPLLTQVRRPACGCGYADVEEMKRAAAEAAKQPQLSTEEKNERKLQAVRATREHGKQLFGEGKYAEAFAVYERGVLIASGALGASAAVQEELSQLEVLLDLNMSLCKLKQCEWKEAQDQARMALQLDPQSVKAHFRMAQGAVGMANWDEAREHLAHASALDAKQGDACKKEIATLLADIRRKEAEEKAKVRAYQTQLEATLASNKASFAAAASNAAAAASAAESTTTGAQAAAVPAPTAASGTSQTDAAATSAADETDELAQSLRDAALRPSADEDAGWTVDRPTQQPPAQ